MTRTKAIDAVRRAVERCDQHLSGNRDPRLDETYDEQVALYAEALAVMLEVMETGSKDSYYGGRFLSYPVTDGWPFNSELANLLCGAQSAYNFHLTADNDPC